MSFLTKSVNDGVARVALNRPKVNAINEAVVDELSACLTDLSTDDGVKALILTGTGHFFSFGLDIPEFLGYAKPDFTRFVTKFASLYTQVFEFPKPVIGALNGHTIAGGCMISLSCDYRVMVSGKARISLNEVNFGSSLFPGSAVSLQYVVGQRNAEIVGLTGAMFSAEEAKELGLVDRVASQEDLEQVVAAMARDAAARSGVAYRSIKKLLRESAAEEMRRKDLRYRDEMVNIWYSEDTWKRLQNIKIHG